MRVFLLASRLNEIKLHGAFLDSRRHFSFNYTAPEVHTSILSPRHKRRGSVQAIDQCKCKCEGSVELTIIYVLFK